ncbi:phage protein GemA/Gp16 family protein [Campylobacter majalis]|uniref:phage protein GemA/Gp16 family protein n=1 Tax=Campylobacter majalis TaxID=2790656 RepID=UPI003D69335B
MLELVGYKPYKGIKFKEPIAKKGKASKKQIAMIYGLWNEVARDKREWALRKFIDRIIGKKPLYLWYLSKTEASDVILGLRNMAKKAKDAK